MNKMEWPLQVEGKKRSRTKLFLFWDKDGDLLFYTSNPELKTDVSRYRMQTVIEPDDDE